jgi:hypothetical protein
MSLIDEAQRHAEAKEQERRNTASALEVQERDRLAKWMTDMYGQPVVFQGLQEVAYVKDVRRDFGGSYQEVLTVPTRTFLVGGEVVIAQKPSSQGRLGRDVGLLRPCSTGCGRPSVGQSLSVYTAANATDEKRREALIAALAQRLNVKPLCAWCEVAEKHQVCSTCGRTM